MRERYHHGATPKSKAHGFVTLLAMLSVLLTTSPAYPQGTGATPKDCVEIASNVPGTVHEGRYNILCLRPSPGPVEIRCRADGVPGPNRLAVSPFAIARIKPHVVEITRDGPMLAVAGVARENAHLFFSYDGPFQPIRDRYTLTCTW